MNSYRILIVEDEAIVAMDIEDRVAAMGYELVGRASSGEQALMLVEKQKPDLILMDIRLQGDMDGITSAELIRNRFHLPVIFLTAYSEDSTLERAKLAEPYGYILKPFDDRELKSAIDIALYKHQAEEEIRRLSRLYDVLSQVNQAVVRTQSREELLPKVCRLVVERGEIDLAWIGWLDPTTTRINQVAFFGDRSEILDEVEFYAHDLPDGQGNPGKAIREGTPFVCNACADADCLHPSMNAPARFGFQSSGSFPLRFQGRVQGALNLYVAEPGFFREREIALLSEVATDVSFALDKIEGDAQRERLKELFEQQSMILRVLMDAMPYPVFYKDTRLRFLGCNTAFEQIAGAKREQIVGRTVHEIWPPDLADAYHRADLELLGSNDHRTIVNDVTLPDSDGGKKEFLCHKAVFQNQDGTVGGIIGAMVDVTSLKRAVEELSASKERFRLAMLGASDGLWDLDLKTNRVYYSPRWKSLIGYGENELVDHLDTWKSLIHKDDLELALAKMHDLAEGRSEKYRAEFRMRHKKGHYLDILSRAICVRDSNGEAVRMVGTHVDISERKRTEHALRKSEIFNRSLVEHLPQRIFLKDCNSVYVSCNANYAKDLGIRPEDIVGKDDYAFHPRELADLYRANDQRVMADFKPKDIEERYLVEGKERWIHTIKVPYRDEAGEVIGVMGIFEDITEHKQAETERIRVEAQLRQAQKMEALGTLAGGIAHDFNNILGIIMGFTEMTRWELGEGSTVIDKLDEVLKASNRAKELVKQILAFSRRTEQQKMPLQLGMVVKEALRILRPSLPSTIEIKTDVQSKAAVLADPTQMHQVLMNLCTNAAHSMQAEGGVLAVRLADVFIGPESIASSDGLKSGPHVELTVRDTGHGIDQEIIDLIFDPFFTTKKMGEGTGLGLSVVHGIVKSHEGKIDVESIPGEGTVFTVLIPALEVEYEAKKPDLATSFPRGRERILVVDDEPQLADILKKMLVGLGYDVISLTNGTEAMETFRNRRKEEKPFDLVITDMTMPHFTGVDLADELCKHQPEVPVILMTGFSKNIDAEAAKARGIKAFLNKPVGLEELSKIVREVLDRRKV